MSTHSPIRPTTSPPTLRASAELGELAAALAAAQGRILGAVEDSTSQRHQYASLTACWQACRAALSGQSLAVVQGLSCSAGELVCTSRLVHASGQWIEVALALPVGDSKGLSAAQAIGSVGTYARRYSLCALVGIAPAGDDTDAAPAPAPAPAKTKTAKTAKTAKTKTAKTKTAKRWSDPARRRFHLDLESVGWKYDDLCAFLAWLSTSGRRSSAGRPSSMSSHARTALLEWLQTEPSRAHYRDYQADQADDQADNSEPF